MVEFNEFEDCKKEVEVEVVVDDDDDDELY